MKPVPEKLPFVVLHSPELGATVVHVPVDSAYLFAEIHVSDDEVVLATESGERHVLDEVGPEARALIEGDHPVFVEHSDADGEGFPEIWYPVRRAEPVPAFGS